MAYSAYIDSDIGYDLSLFESSGTSAPKLNPARKPSQEHRRIKQARDNIIEMPTIEVEKSQRRKHNVASIVLGFICAAVITLCIGVIIQGQVQLTELNQKIASAEQTLSDSKSEYTQMQAKVEASLSTSAVEKYAREKLGMTKATSQQKEYISLSDGDKAQVYTEKSDDIFSRIGAFFGSLWS